MTTCASIARRAAFALAGLTLAALVPAGADAATTPAELRVLTPEKVLDPGTTYYIDDSVTVKTSPQADCLGPPGGSGAEYTYDDPVALGLLASAARTSAKLRPLLLTDQFGFGLAICGIGGFEAEQGKSFWYLKANQEEASVGADQLALRRGDEVLFYLAPDRFPAPNPAELELRAPARAAAGEPFTVSVTEHSCVTDSQTFETTCESKPAAGVKISGGERAATTGADGSAEVSLAKSRKLVAARAQDIPSQRLKVCVADELDECPPGRGERIVGSSAADRIKGTSGPDKIRARAGRDRIDVRKGGGDRVDCGPGRDTVLAKRSDRKLKLARDCERIRRR